jgi:8-oxo-dGTP pyrophosphatase MutT (NUDIX family)
MISRDVSRDITGTEWLVFDRPDGSGVASVAGHVYDQHAHYKDAARAETVEETGLTVTSLRYITGGWRDNRCSRAPRPGNEIGHRWRVYQATTTGTLSPSLRETRNLRWVTEPGLHDLALRTADLAHDRITLTDWTTWPGLEAVWVMWFHDAGVVRVPSADLDVIERLAELGPVRCLMCASEDVDGLGRCYDPGIDRLVWLCPPCQAATGHHPVPARTSGPTS